MRRYLAMAGAAVLLLAGCVKSPLPLSNQTRISVEDFARMFVDYLKDTSAPQTDIAGDFADITPDAVFEETGCQIFKDSATYESYLLSDGEVTPVATGFGGFGITDILPCDLDENGQTDILYAYSWGSGLHRSQLSVYNLTDKAETTLDYVNLNNDMLLEEENGTINVYSAVFRSALPSDGSIINGMVKGELLCTLTAENGGPKITEMIPQKSIE